MGSQRAEDRSAWREECYNAVNGLQEVICPEMTKKRKSQGSSCSKKGSLSLSFLHLRHIHLRYMWTDLFITNRPVQSPTKPSLRFVASTTHSRRYAAQQQIRTTSIFKDSQLSYTCEVKTVSIVQYCGKTTLTRLHFILHRTIGDYRPLPYCRF